MGLVVARSCKKMSNCQLEAMISFMVMLSLMAIVMLFTETVSNYPKNVKADAYHV